MSKIKVGVIGACGKMGQVISEGVRADSDLELVLAIDKMHSGKDLGEINGGKKIGVQIYSDTDLALKENEVDVIIDFTNINALKVNYPIVLSNKVNLVIGTTGLSDEEMKDIESLAEKNGVGAFLAPNFSIGAVLMMKYAQDAAKYLPNVEIIELHHDEKLDAPSGTAIKTMEQIAKSRKAFSQGAKGEFEKIQGSRGGDYEGMRVHSVRLPGYVAHQEVIFGGIGQTLTIRHDSISRESFISGVMLATKKVSSWKGLVYGLEEMLDN